MVRDIILDIQEGDFGFRDKSEHSGPVFDTVWGNLFEQDAQEGGLICNIVVPEALSEAVKYHQNKMLLRFTSRYVPIEREFTLRPVMLGEGGYSVFSEIRDYVGNPASSYATSKNIASPLKASMMPFIDVDGEFLAEFVKSDVSEAYDRAYVYSAKSTDLVIDLSDDQASQLLSLSVPGQSYRYPTTGVGITRYLNSVVSHTDLGERLEKQFSMDGKPLQSAYFDNKTGRLDVLFTPEQGIADTDLEEADIEFFKNFTDEHLRKNTVVTEVSVEEFINAVKEYENVMNLILFVDETTFTERITAHVEAGRFDGEGNIVPSQDHYIITDTLEADTVIMFDDKAEDSVDDSPVFIVNGIDETRLYTSLVGQSYWIERNCHKCFILKKKANVKYQISRDQYRTGRGLHVVAKTSANIKNMAGLVQDPNTGRLLGIVSESTNISDMTLDEITQRVYATHSPRRTRP